MERDFDRLIRALDGAGYPADEPVAKSRWPLILYPLAVIGASGAAYCLYRAGLALVGA